MVLQGISVHQAQALPDLCLQLLNIPGPPMTPRLLAHSVTALKPVVRSGSCPALLVGMPKLQETVLGGLDSNPSDGAGSVLLRVPG